MGGVVLRPGIEQLAVVIASNRAPARILVNCRVKGLFKLFSGTWPD